MKGIRYSRIGNKIVFCEHNVCKDEPTCLGYQLAVANQQDREEFEESFPELDVEDYF